MMDFQRPQCTLVLQLFIINEKVILLRKYLVMSKKRLCGAIISLLFVVNPLLAVVSRNSNPKSKITDGLSIYVINNASFQQTHAADELSRYAKAMTGDELAVKTADKGETGGNGFVICLISNIDEMANKAIADKIKTNLGEHREAYVILSGVGDTVYLIGRTDVGCIYAVYDYLSSVCGCGFFQDGEFVPQLKELPRKNIELVRQPRFDNRRHLAWEWHASLKKYDSRYWSLDEWKREFDWMAKQRLNMYRLGMTSMGRFAGDAFQQAYPEIGPEPKELLRDRLGGWTSSWGWPPEYRTKMTQEMLAYARARGIKFMYDIFPGDIPLRFKDVHPEIKYDPDNNYGETHVISPDAPEFVNVTKKYLAKIIELFGTDHLYFAAPYCEHTVAGGFDENMRLRTKASKLLVETFKSVDPESVWVFGNWDWVHHNKGMWAPNRAKAYLDNFDNNDMYFADVAGDMETPPFYETYDGFYGKRWAFGVLQSFAGDDGLHGDPVGVIDRIKKAATYKNCIGVHMAPELTHQNVMYWDLVSYLAWNPEDINYSDYLKDFTRRRYGSENAAPMVDVWQKVTDAVLQYGPDTGDKYPIARYRSNNSYYKWTYEGFGDINAFPLFSDRQHLLKLDKHIPSARKQVVLLKDALGLMLAQSDKNASNPLYVEDLVVIYRSYMGKLFNLQAATAYYAFGNGDKENFEKYRDCSMAILDAIADVLSGCPSYSINKMTEEVTSVPGHNEKLPEMIRNGGINADYSTLDVYEQFGGYYIPRMKYYFEMLEGKLDTGDTQITKAEVSAKLEELKDDYRANGWSSSANPVEPISEVAKHFKNFSLLDNNKDNQKIETEFWAEEPGSGYYFLEDFDSDSLNKENWEYDNVDIQDGICSVKGLLKFTKPLWQEKELIQAAVKMSKPASENRFPVLLSLSVGSGLEDNPKGEITLQSNTNLNQRWLDSKGWRQVWNATDGVDKWHVYGMLPTKNGISFYVKNGRQPFAPDNLPDPIFSIVSGKISDDLFCYILPRWEGSHGGNTIEVDWLQVGNPKNSNTFDFVAPEIDSGNEK